MSKKKRGFLDSATKARLKHAPDWHGYTRAGLEARQTIFVDMKSRATHPDPAVKLVKMPRLSTAIAKRLPARKESLGPGARVRSAYKDGTIVWGSVGAFVLVGNSPYLLTANHVIAGNGKFINLSDRSGSRGVSAGYPDKYVGAVVGFPCILPAEENLADVALCKVEVSMPASPLYPAEWKLTDGRPYRPKKNDRVKLRSRSGKDVIGKVKVASGAFHVHLPMLGDIDAALFVDQILISGVDGAFAEEGDSGKLVVLAEPGKECRPVGLVVGATEEHPEESYVMVTPLENILIGAKTVTDAVPQWWGHQGWEWGTYLPECKKDNLLKLDRILV